MGIPDFVSWLKELGRRDVPRIIYNRPKGLVSSLAIDANALFHEVAQKVYAYEKNADPVAQHRRAQAIMKLDKVFLENEYINAILAQLLLTVESYNPKDVLIIAVDGVVPMAKIIQQRKRRYGAVMVDEKIHLRGKWHSNILTPGTDLMIRIDQAIQTWIGVERKRLPPTVIYSSHLVPGEGEHKIADLYRQGAIPVSGSHVLYGADADLIMLGLVAPVKELWISRSFTQAIDITALRNWLKTEMNTNTWNDFIVMSFLIGNDFLPQVAATSSLAKFYDLLFQEYRRVKEQVLGKSTADFLVKKIRGIDQIDFTALSQFLTALASYETVLLTEKINDLAAKRIPAGEIVRQAATTGFLDFKEFRRRWYLRMFPLVSSGFVAPITQSCVDYLESLNWILGYYLIGTHGINIQNFYPHHFAPLLIDLSQVARSQGELLGFLAPADQEFYSPIHQLLAVMPPQLSYLVPGEVRFLMAPNSPISDYFPYRLLYSDEPVDQEHKRILLINFVTMPRIIQAVADLAGFSPERAAQLSAVGNRFYVDEVARLTTGSSEKMAQDIQERELARIDTRALGLPPTGGRVTGSGQSRPPRKGGERRRGVRSPPRGGSREVDRGVRSPPRRDERPIDTRDVRSPPRRGGSREVDRGVRSPPRRKPDRGVSRGGYKNDRYIAPGSRLEKRTGKRPAGPLPYVGAPLYNPDVAVVGATPPAFRPYDPNMPTTSPALTRPLTLTGPPEGSERQLERAELRAT